MSLRGLCVVILGTIINKYVNLSTNFQITSEKQAAVKNNSTDNKKNACSAELLIQLLNKCILCTTTTTTSEVSKNGRGRFFSIINTIKLENSILLVVTNIHLAIEFIWRLLVVLSHVVAEELIFMRYLNRCVLGHGSLLGPKLKCARCRAPTENAQLNLTEVESVGHRQISFGVNQCPFTCISTNLSCKYRCRNIFEVFR